MHLLLWYKQLSIHSRTLVRSNWSRSYRRSYVCYSVFWNNNFECESLRTNAQFAALLQNAFLTNTARKTPCNTRYTHSSSPKDILCNFSRFTVLSAHACIEHHYGNIFHPRVRRIRVNYEMLIFFCRPSKLRGYDGIMFCTVVSISNILVGCHLFLYTLISHCDVYQACRLCVHLFMFAICGV